MIKGDKSIICVDCVSFSEANRWGHEAQPTWTELVAKEQGEVLVLWALPCVVASRSLMDAPCFRTCSGSTCFSLCSWFVRLHCVLTPARAISRIVALNAVWKPRAARVGGGDSDNYWEIPRLWHFNFAAWRWQSMTFCECKTSLWHFVPEWLMMWLTPRS